MKGWIHCCVAVTMLLLASLAGAQTLTVPLKFDGPRILVTVGVNGKSARLLLDTGAGTTFIGPNLADGTMELKRMTVFQQAGSRQASVRRVNITLGELTFKNQAVGVLDMRNVNGLMGATIDGVLGEDILANFRSVRINYKDKTLELEQ